MSSFSTVNDNISICSRYSLTSDASSPTSRKVYRHHSRSLWPNCQYAKSGTNTNNSFQGPTMLQISYRWQWRTSSISIEHNSCASIAIIVMWKFHNVTLKIIERLQKDVPKMAAGAAVNRCSVISAKFGGGAAKLVKVALWRMTARAYLN